MIHNSMIFRSIMTSTKYFFESYAEKLNYETTTEPYVGLLPLKGYFSWIHHYTKNTDFYISMNPRLIQRQFKILYGAGITKSVGRILSANITVTKIPQQLFNIGASIAVTSHGVQFYIASDQTTTYSVLDMKSLNLNFGFNLAINKKEKKDKNLSTTFLGNRVKVYEKKGLYSIIKKQKRKN